MKKNKWVLFSIVTFGWAIHSMSQGVSASIQPTNIMIGDHMELTLKAESKNNRSCQFPTISDSTMGPFRLVEKLKTDTLYSGNQMVIQQKYAITCFEDSLQTFPALTFHSGLDSAQHSLPINVMVTTVKLDTSDQPKPIKNIIQIPLTKAEVFSYLFTSLIFLALLIFIYIVYIKYIKKEDFTDRAKSMDPPHVVALKSLKDTENKQLWQKGQFKEYYDQISDCIRFYIQKRFGIHAMEMTTGELFEYAAKLDLEPTTLAELKNMLELSDLAKFANEQPSEENNLQILNNAYAFVQKTQMQYDSNKKADAKRVKKFYAQNKYSIRPIALNQMILKTLIYGMMIVFGVIALTIFLSYQLPINLALSILATYPFYFFLTGILIGAMIVCIVAWTVQMRWKNYLVVFDYDSLIVKTHKARNLILFRDLISSQIDPKNGSLILEDKTNSKIVLNKNLEYFDEIKERIEDIIHIELHGL